MLIVRRSHCQHTVLSSIQHTFTEHLLDVARCQEEVLRALRPSLGSVVCYRSRRITITWVTSLLQASVSSSVKLGNLVKFNLWGLDGVSVKMPIKVTANKGTGKLWNNPLDVSTGSRLCVLRGEKKDGVLLRQLEWGTCMSWGTSLISVKWNAWGAMWQAVVKTITNSGATLADTSPRLAGWPWVSHLLRLSLRFLICPTVLGRFNKLIYVNYLEQCLPQEGLHVWLLFVIT